MKKTTRALALLLLIATVLATALVTASCDNANAVHAGTYRGEFTLEFQYGGGDGRPAIKASHDIRAELVLDKKGNYTFSTWHNSEFTNMTYSEKGTYTLSGDEITLVPAECMFMVKGGGGEMRTLTADEQASMTTKGTLKDNTVTAKMRWLYNYHNVASEMQLVRDVE